MPDATLNEQFISAARDGDLQALKELLDKGADPCFENSQALIEAAQGFYEKHTQCTQYLLAHCDVSAQDSLVLIIALYHYDFPLTSLLLPYFVGFKDPRRLTTALKEAIRIGHDEAFETFLPLCHPEDYQDLMMDFVLSHKPLFVAKHLDKIDTSKIDMNAFLKDIRAIQSELSGPSLKISNMIQSFFEAKLLEEHLPHIYAAPGKTHKTSL